MLRTPKGSEGWFWYIPLHDDRISVGVVGPFDYLFKGRESHEQTYQEEVEARGVEPLTFSLRTRRSTN